MSLVERVAGARIARLLTRAVRDVQAGTNRHRLHESPDAIEECFSEESAGTTAPPSGDAQAERAREEPACVPRRERADALCSCACESF